MPTTPGSGTKGQAVAWLATCLTLTAGVGACTLIAIAMQADLTGMWRTAGPLGAGILFLWWLLRDRSPTNRQADRWGWLKRRPAKKTQLVLTRAKSTPLAAPPASPAGPPTAESIRELKGGLNTWVPSERRRGKPDRPSTP